MLLKVFYGSVASVFMQKDWAVLEIKVSERRFLDRSGRLIQNQWTEADAWLYEVKFWGYNLFYNREKLEHLQLGDKIMISYNGINCERISLKKL